MYEISPTKDFFVGIDSDGCVFDSMELKHKECFIPQIIKHYGLQGVSKYAREAAEFVNLYSKSRGINRFPALVEALEWLTKRSNVSARGVEVKIPQGLVDWMAKEDKLGNPALEEAVKNSDCPDLKQALDWSLAVNAFIADMVANVAPFPSVRGCLEKFSEHCDMLVVSATPNEALNTEWTENNIRQFVTEICGQETGSKKEVLKNSAKYPENHSLMIGDAPKDREAAVANNVLFYPINPGAEEESWKRLLEEGIGKFIDGTFAGAYQDAINEEYDSYLPENPPWDDLV